MAKFAGVMCAWLLASVMCPLLWSGGPVSAVTTVANDGAADAAHADRAAPTAATTQAAAFANPDAQVEQEDGEPPAAIHTSPARTAQPRRARVSTPDDVPARVDLPPILPAPLA